MGAKSGTSKKDKLSIEEFRKDRRVTTPKFVPNPTFNTYEDRATEPWHRFILDRGLEGEFMMYPNGVIVSKKGLALQMPK